MAKFRLTLIPAFAMCLASSAYSAEVGIIIYSETGGTRSTAEELRKHELGHLLCPEWKHPNRLQSNGRLFMPPPTLNCFKRKPRFEIIEVRVPLAEAMDRCANADRSNGGKGERSTGCSYVIDE